MGGMMREPDVMRIRILAEFETPEGVKDAARALRDRGYTLFEGFVPWELEGLERIMELPRGRIPLYALIAGIAGAVVGYGIQWWTNTIDYPINVGGRPLHPFLSYIPITFETAILFASIATFLAVILGSRLPMPWQPLFEVPGFHRSTDDRFFLGIDERDPIFAFERAREDLLAAGALRVERVPEAREIVAREKRRERESLRGPEPGTPSGPEDRAPEGGAR